MTIICSYKDECKNLECGHRKPHDTVNNKWKNCLQATDGIWCYMANNKVTCIPTDEKIIPDIDLDAWSKWAENTEYSNIGFEFPPKFDAFPDNDDGLYDISDIPTMKGGDYEKNANDE